jgi:Flp pilus assembly pilin Flp
MRHIQRFLRNDGGQDIIEYALLAAFISIVSLATIKLIGPLVSNVYGTIQTAIS